MSTRLEAIRRRWDADSPGPCQADAAEDVAYLLTRLEVAESVIHDGRMWAVYEAIAVWRGAGP